MRLPTKIGIGGAALTLLGAGFGWCLFPWFLNSQIAKSKGLAPGAEIRQMWSKVPFAIDFKIYVFNVTNHEAVQQGDIPMLDEIGPFVYDEWKEKVELVDHEADDSVFFNMKDTFIFNPEKSYPLTGNEVVFIPHPALVGMIGAVARDKPGALGMVSKAIPALFNSPDSVFLKTTVHDLLFGGNVINCTSKEFAPAAICTLLRKEGKDLEKIDNGTILKFSILKARNGTKNPNRFQVNRGILDYKKVGEMVTLNGKKKLETWRGKPCNDLSGTDSTIFAPFTTPQDLLVSFSPDLCRSLAAFYEKPSSFKGIQTLRFTASFGDMSTDPQLKCFCWNETMCMKKGVMDMMKCTGAPAVASFPHFYDAHEDYVKGVRGLHPEYEKHAVIVDMEPLTGSPVYGKRRLQFSLPINKINKIDITANLPTSVVPFIWLEEGVEISDEFVAKIDGQLFKVIRAVDVAKWVLTVLGGLILGGGVGLYYKQHNNLSISPSTTANRRAADLANDFIGSNKKPQSGEPDGGHQNFGYI